MHDGPVMVSWADLAVRDGHKLRAIEIDLDSSVVVCAELFFDLSCILGFLQLLLVVQDVDAAVLDELVAIGACVLVQEAEGVAHFVGHG